MRIINLSFLFTGVFGTGAIFSINRSNDLFVSTSAPIFQNQPFWSSPNWRKINSGTTEISCNSSNDCWAVNGGQLFYFGDIVNGSPLWRYKYMNSKVKSLSVANDGTVWGVTTNNDIFNGKDGAAFDHVGKGLDVAGISSYEALIVGEDGQLYNYIKPMFAPGIWRLNPNLGSDRLTKVSRCKNGDIWAIRNDGAIWRQVTNRVRVHHQIQDKTISGVKPGTSATDIVCKNNRIYHTNGNDDVFIYIFDKYDSNNWRLVPSTKAVALG